MDVASLAALTNSWQSPIEDPTELSPTALRSLVGDARFRTLVFQRSINDGLMLGELDTLMARVTEVLALLDAEITG